VNVSFSAGQPSISESSREMFVSAASAVKNSKPQAFQGGIAFYYNWNWARSMEKHEAKGSGREKKRLEEIDADKDVYQRSTKRQGGKKKTARRSLKKRRKRRWRRVQGPAGEGLTQKSDGKRGLRGIKRGPVQPEQP